MYIQIKSTIPIWESTQFNVFLSLLVDSQLKGKELCKLGTCLKNYSFMKAYEGNSYQQYSCLQVPHQHFCLCIRGCLSTICLDGITGRNAEEEGVEAGAGWLAGSNVGPGMVSPPKSLKCWQKEEMISASLHRLIKDHLHWPLHIIPINLIHLW